MIEKTISIICDYCSSGIDHYTGYTVEQAIKVAKETGVVFKTGKHFCSVDCLLNYRQNNSRPAHLHPGASR